MVAAAVLMVLIEKADARGAARLLPKGFARSLRSLHPFTSALHLLAYCISSFAHRFTTCVISSFAI
jgi:hypothetical protein